MSTLEKPKPAVVGIAREYLRRGWAPIPVHEGAKRPAVADWQNLRLTEQDLEAYFPGASWNVGVRLGEPSGGLVDIDLDCSEAVRLAPRYLPSTCTFGRLGKARSHWLYTCGDVSTRQFKDPAGSVLLEIRSTGAQTVFPGSVHTSGEHIYFENPDVAVADVTGSTLELMCCRLAAASLIAKHWPAQGARQEAALALAGTLMRGGWSAAQASRFISEVADAADDEEADKRGNSALSTGAQLERDNPTTGVPTLKRLLGDRVVDRALEWLDIDEAVPVWLEEMNAKYFVVNEAGKAWVYQNMRDDGLERDLLIRLSFEDLKKLYLNDRVVCEGGSNGRETFRDKATAWLMHKNRRQFIDGVTFDPSGAVAPGKFNLWRGLAVQPEPGDWSLMRIHLRDVICSSEQDSYDYLINWFARLLQDPGSPGEVAVVLQGGRGAGKGTVGNAFMKIFGHHAMYLTNSKHLTGNFNAHLRDAVFVFADEAFYAGDRAHESVLKGLVTDPYITIEAKYQNATTARNVAHILMASNESWVVPAACDERRFFVLRVDDVKQQDIDYFAALYKELESGGLSAMVHDLLARDIRGFNVRQVPQTRALMRQKIESLRGVEAWLFEVLANASMPEMFNTTFTRSSEWGDCELEVNKEYAYRSYIEFSRLRKEYSPASQSEWGRRIRNILGDECRDVRRRAPPEGASGTARTRALILGPLASCRQKMESRLGGEVDWPEPPVEQQAEIESNSLFDLRTARLRVAGG